MEASEDNPVERIDAIELRIDELTEAIAQSGRLMSAGRAAAGAGPLLILAQILGVIGMSPARVLVVIALTIGGVVLAGASKSSTAELERRRAQAEAERSAAIDALGLVSAGRREG